MKKFRLNIDGKEVIGISGQTILEVAKENDIYIPTLCFDERTTIYGACGICVCEVEGNPKMVKACATEIAPNMIIKTNTKRVLESRKTNLELLLSNHVGDCKAPCSVNCPAETDCQGYVGLIANGQFESAIELIKDKIPLPASLGRVCPHPCEDKCRRKLIEEPISVQWLKRFVADWDLLENDNPFMPSIESDSGKRVAIIGGGPMGLSAGYFLRKMGHNVTIFESMPRLGGMLRYGIPEYRLPKQVLDREIALIEKMGVVMVPNTKVGVDVPFETVKADFDAILIAIGAWISTGVGCEGEDSKGVIGGIDFLRKVVRNEEIKLGKNVAIVGGGNTAMDACRTAVRLGAENVYNVYRRTKDEMPADMVEIVEAEEEGVIFKNLTNPLEIIADEDGYAKQMLLQVMELGDPDESGRRAPKPVAGKTETLDVDTVILAIGQAVDASIFDFDKTRKGAILYDPKTFMTSIPGIFAGGDCGNDKISIAVEAIADARKAAEMIDTYLLGEEVGYEKPYLVARDDITEKTFEDRERLCRPEMGHLTPEERKDNFAEIVFGYDDFEAMEEADRCLECGCHDYFECKLIDFANEYDVKPERFAGDTCDEKVEDEHPFIIRDSKKCILCGLCVRACDEVMGVGAIGLVNRGFDTVVMPTLGTSLLDSGCVSCGQCTGVCPTGALQERLSMTKPVPLDTEIATTTCPYCSVGCSISVETHSNMIVKANPDKEGIVNDGLLCGKGKFGLSTSWLDGKILTPQIAEEVSGYEDFADLDDIDDFSSDDLYDEEFREAGYHEAIMLTAKKAQSIAIKYGKDAVAIAISDRHTNEEAYALKKLADVMGAKALCFNNRASGLLPVLGIDASPNTIDELLSTEFILAVGFNTRDNPIIKIKMKQAAENGAKVVLVNPEILKQSNFGFAEEHYTKNKNTFLRGIAKALIDMGKTSDLPGFDKFAKSVEKVKVTSEMKAVAEGYAKAKKAMIVFAQNLVTTETASLLANIALLSGHIGSPRDGILQIKAKNNSQGLIDMGITAGEEALDGVKALLVFGEDPDIDMSELEFLMVSDTHASVIALEADVVFPAVGFGCTDGTFTNTERRLQESAKILSDFVLSSWQIASEIAKVYEVDFGFGSTYDISMEMDDNVPNYKYAMIGEVLGGVLKPQEPKFVAVADGAFVDVLDCTDCHMIMTDMRIPIPQINLQSCCAMK